MWKIFFIALAIRWAYSLILFVTMGEGGLLGQDSYFYLNAAHSFAAQITAGSVHHMQWLGLEPTIMPLAMWLFTIHAMLFGPMAPLTYVLMQGVLDAGTCLFVYGIAATLGPRFALPAAFAACINPTQIVLAGLAYTDTPFVFLIALFLLAATHWLRAPSIRWAIWLGVGLGAAVMVRVLIAPWFYACGLFLLISAWFVHGFRIGYAAQLMITLTVASVSVATLGLNNLGRYGALDLTPQSGYHLLGWIVPLVKEARDGTPWQRTFDELQERKRQRFGEPAKNPFVESMRQATIANEELRNLGRGAMLKAWAYGAVINLVAPAVILSPPVSQLPRTGFFGTTGATLLEKIKNFIFSSDNALYARILQAGILGVVVMRLIQTIGFATILRNKSNLAIALLFVCWIVYVLLVNGPIASPKYRLPIEPVLAVLTGIGYCVLRDWRQRARLA